MGQAFDKDGRVLGEAEGATRRDVLDALEKRHPEAVEMRIRQIEAVARGQVPTIGRTVLYRLSAQDAEEIRRRRTSGASIADRMRSVVQNGEAAPVYAWPAGAQAHIGNDVSEGMEFPMVIVKVWGTSVESCVNGQVLLDGNDVLWATSRNVGTQPGTWHWPERT